MGLSLTSTAAPDLTLEALDAACRARGLDGLELVWAATEAPESFAETARGSGARIVALRAESLDRWSASVIARLGATLGAPVSVPAEIVGRTGLDVLGGIFADAGARLLVSHPTDLERTLALARAIDDAGVSGSVGLAWEIRPSTERLTDGGAVLFAAQEKLGLVRLFGGGPEQSDQDGRGIGPLLGDLARARYAGPIVLVPTREEERPRWRRWLDSQKPAGCGSRAASKEILVDVREVEPKDRLETILGAYKSLEPGGTLKLTVDHDPSCMYYMLEATEPAGSFAFQVLERGPETWRAEVRRR